jgi:cellulose synthase/poly-beta-1,6-N-acetylglucosamine synthase-like glycosyltransferase/peptidoglycan/xylan/chitin deacetylase (PgdA/CDA1 family)/spore germination protein YaaH
MSSTQIFLDPEGRRWRRWRRLLNVTGALITIVVLVFVVSVVRGGELPSLLLPEPSRPYRALRDREKERHLSVRRAANENKRLARRQRRQNVLTRAGDPGPGVRAAFYVVWEATSFAALKEYHNQIDILFPDWLHVPHADGRLYSYNPTNGTLNPVVEGGKVISPDDKVMPFLRSENDDMKVMPLVSNFDPTTNRWTSDVGAFLMDPAARQTFRREVLRLLASDRFAGLNLDFEEIPYPAQPGLLALIRELRSDFAPHGWKLYANVPPDNRDFDFAALSADLDGLILMNYDQHNQNTGPGPIAAQEWFTRNLHQALQAVPRQKLMCAIGSYSYDWYTQLAPGRDRGKVIRVDATTTQEAWLHARESEVDVDFDDDALNPHFSFIESDHVRHDVYLLDAVTAANQMRVAQSLGVNQFALWRLGGEDRSLWAIWDDPAHPQAAEHLRAVPAGPDIAYEGSGEILRVMGRPRDGARTVSLDADTGLFDGETMTELPMPYQIARYGDDPTRIALTFDDGPDPEWTPKVLEALASRGVKGTFFVIGLQAEKYPGLLRRMMAEGHEIGNHTFTHPNIANIGRRYMDVELNLTERLLESKLGVKPVFFRPPYSIDQEPDTADEVRPLERVQERGYITVGNKLDTNDWREDLVRSPQEMAEDVLAQIADNKRRGLAHSVLLLHDGGGNRARTVAALPVIIDALRSHGYELVPVSRLLGRSRAEVMPAITAGERAMAIVDSIAFDLFRLVILAITAVFFLGDFLMTGRLLTVSAGALVDRFRRRGVPPQSVVFQPPVAVLVPAFNEEKVIAHTVRSVLASSYPRVRVIVVDDGSSDRTFEVVRHEFASEIASGKVVALTKPNGGKSAAANFGLRHVTEEIFVAIDADTVIHPEAIARMVPHFADPRIAAIAGNAKVGNRVNVWTRWQALEYITSQNFERRALNAMGAVSVVPGAIGAWRTGAVRAVGGYPGETVAEDADLTMSLLQAGFRVQYEDRALAFTEAPIHVSGLMRQRFRWSFGILQAVWKHRGAFWRGGALGWIALPNIVIFQILLPLVSPFIDLMYLVGALTYLADRFFHPDSANPADFERLTLFFLLFLLIDFLNALAAFALERREARLPEDKWLLAEVWLQRFAYRQIFSVVLFKTLKRAFTGRPFNWDKLERTASLTHAQAG